MALGIVSLAVVAAAVLSVVELGLTAYVASGYRGNSNSWWWSRSPDIVNFMIFNSVWSLLVLAYVGITPLYYTRIFHRLVSLALLAITTIFWFAGSIAMAVWLGVPNCGGNSWCGSAQAAVAFGFFIWAIFMGLTILDTIDAMRSRRHHTGAHVHTHKHGHTYPGV